MTSRSRRLVGDALLTSKEAAEYIHRPEIKLRQWRMIPGVGPKFLKLGPVTVMYRQSDIDAWLLAAERTSTSDPGPAKPATKPAKSATAGKAGRLTETKVSA